MTLPDYYCASLHNKVELSLKSEGITVSPCNKEPHVFPVTSNPFLNPALISIRAINQFENRLVGPCVNCVRNEETGLSCQTRKAANEQLNGETVFDLTGPTEITFKLDYTCNLACVTCGPHLSTRWRSYDNIPGLPVSVNSETVKTLIRGIDLENLRTVHIFGGEPLLTETHKTILTELLPYSKNITVWYDTNATVFPCQEVLELWDKFQAVRLKFSIDGIGSVFEYLRWPGIWSKAEDTMLRLKEQAPVNTMFSMRPAIGVLNFHVIDDIRKWYNANLSANRLGDASDFEYNIVYGLFNASAMSELMSQDVKLMYASTDPLIEILAAPSNPQLSLIKSKLLELDSKRNTNWQESLPHLVKYLVDL